MKRTQNKNPDPGINTRKALILTVLEDLTGSVDSQDLPPLFDEIPPHLRTAYEDVGKICSTFCDEHPDIPLREGCLQLLDVLVRRDTDPPPLSWGRDEIWAGGLLYATGQVMGLTRRKTGLHVSADEVATFCHASGITMHHKAQDIRREVRTVKQWSGKDKQGGDLKGIFSPDWAERFSNWAGGDDPEQPTNNEALPVTPPKSPGTCFICNEKVTGAIFDEHIDSCLPTMGWREPNEPGLLMRIMDAYRRRYWLVALAGPETTLKDLDSLIRQVWVSCCGHLSAFSIGNMSFNSDGEGEGMHVYIKDVLLPGDSCKYTYDFGSSTILKVTALRRMNSSPPGDDLVLLGQNCKVHRRCSVCGTDATMYYQKGWDEKPRFFCDTCAETTSRNSEWLYGIGNSPRNGVCGCYHSDEDGVDWHPAQVTAGLKAGKKRRHPAVRRYNRDNLYRTLPGHFYR